MMKKKVTSNIAIFKKILADTSKARLEEKNTIFISPKIAETPSDCYRIFPCHAGLHAAVFIQNGGGVVKIIGGGGVSA